MTTSPPRRSLFHRITERRLSRAPAGRDSQGKDAFVLFTIAAFTFFGLVNGIANPLFNAIDPALFWLADLACYTLFPVACLAYLAWRFGVVPSDYGFRQKVRFGDFVGATILLTLALYATYEFFRHVSWLVLYHADMAGLAEPFFLYDRVLPAGLPRIPGALYLSITAGVIESIVFIGLPWHLWRQKFGRTRNAAFVLLSATVFACIHWEQGASGVIGALAYGAVACALYLKLSDLGPVAAAHTLIDLVIFW